MRLVFEGLGYINIYANQRIEGHLLSLLTKFSSQFVFRDEIFRDVSKERIM
jgi:hypothetical protein